MATGTPAATRSKALDYSLVYPDKIDCAAVLELPAVEPVAIAVASQSGHLYRGDNLATLLWLRGNPAVRQQVRTVYIDPPYATAMTFLDRDGHHAYDDHLIGAGYLEALRRRLIVLHDLLADDGSIFVHLDQNMVFEAKIILDEIFGRGNFRNFITRKKCNTKNSARKRFGNIADHILYYAKSGKGIWNRQYDSWTDKKTIEEYPCIDEKTGRRYKKVAVHAPGVRRGETGLPWRGKLPPKGKHWQYRPKILDELDAAGEIYWSPNGNPRRKVYFDRSNGIPAQDIWMGFKDAHNQNIQITGYPTEKNFELVSRLIAATSNPGDLVLDCYCGSGTSLEAATLLGRRFVGIDLAEPAIRAAVKRLQDGRRAMGDFVGSKKSKRKGQSDLFSASE